MERTRAVVAALAAAAALGAALGALSAAPARAPAPKGPGPTRVVAGNGRAGFADGTGQEARFHKPIRLAALGRDSVVVADIFNHAIRAVWLDGRVRTLAGGPDRKGFRDGPAEEAQVASPHGVAVSAAGVIAVAEASNHTIRLLTPERGEGVEGEGVAGEGGRGEGVAARYTISTLAGAAGQEGEADGPAAEARFRSPHAAAWDRDGSLLVPDIGNARLRRVRDRRVETVAGAEKGTFVYPMDVAFAPDGTLLVADAGANLIRTWTPSAGVGTLKIEGELRTPHGVAAGEDGTVYVADMNAHQVVAIDRSGRVTRVAGTGEAGPGPSQLDKPAAVLVHAGHLWIADLDNHRIVVVLLL
jgi:DNA-binding beta-propeller fold protein YncE